MPSYDTRTKPSSPSSSSFSSSFSYASYYPSPSDYSPTTTTNNNNNLRSCLRRPLSDGEVERKRRSLLSSATTSSSSYEPRKKRVDWGVVSETYFIDGHPVVVSQSVHERKQKERPVKYHGPAKTKGAPHLSAAEPKPSPSASANEASSAPLPLSKTLSPPPARSDLLEDSWSSSYRTRKPQTQPQPRVEIYDSHRRSNTTTTPSNNDNNNKDSSSSSYSSSSSSRERASASVSATSASSSSSRAPTVTTVYKYPSGNDRRYERTYRTSSSYPRERSERYDAYGAAAGERPVTTVNRSVGSGRYPTSDSSYRGYDRGMGRSATPAGRLVDVGYHGSRYV